MEAEQPYIREEQFPSVPIREQDTGELQDIVLRYRPLFYQRAYRYLGNSQDAEDAVQDALLSAYTHLGQFQGKAKMATWLTTIVINSALSKLRKRPRQPHLSLDEPRSEEQNESVAEKLADVRPGPEEECGRSELREYLHQFVTKLPPPMQKAIQLRDLDGLTTIETANILGVSEGTLKAQLWRARSRMKRDARKRGFYK